MAKKSVLSLLFSHRNHHHHHHHHQPHQKTLSATLMEENINSAELILSKFEQASLFYDDRQDAVKFCDAVHELQRSMLFFSSKDCVESPRTRSSSLIRAQILMQTAMKRLEKEFYQILAANRDRLDPESVSHRSPRSSLSDPDADYEDEIRAVSDSIDEVARASAMAMADLRTIAQTMISAGYGKECVKIYTMMRRSIVDEGLYRLGFESLTVAHVQKLDWDVLDLKIGSWLAGAGTAIRTLLAGERILCDHVFEESDPIRESCFAEIAKEAAIRFLAFPELVARWKRSPEKLFRVLDLYSSISDLWTDIESVFSFESTAAVRSQALSTFLKLGEAARLTIADFESAIHKDGSKIAVPGGGIHTLTLYVMDYLALLAEYEFVIADIFVDFPIQLPSPMPESFFDSSTVSSPSSAFDSSPSSVWIRIAWLILVLLCKLDGKAEIFREVSLSYLFLANNLHFIVQRVKESKLRPILGEDWIFKHESKVNHYASSYERLAWAKIAAAIPAVEPLAVTTEKIMNFYTAFEEAVMAQREWVVADERMREEMRESVAEMIVPAYRTFYETYRPIFSGVVLGDVAVVKYAPEDVRARVMELFSGSSGSDLGSGSGNSSGTGSNKSSWWSFKH